MKTKTGKIDKLCEHLLQQEQSHKEFIKKKRCFIGRRIKNQWKLRLEKLKVRKIKWEI